MQKLSAEELMSLESYHRRRSSFRRTVMAHKANRKVAIGSHATLYFEDRLTVHYQIQEMLRVERIFESEAIQQELDVYNPMIPDGDNWMATFMIEYVDEAERHIALERMVGIEDRVWVQIGELERVWAIADEDLQRTKETKTSAVHFLRFQLSGDRVRQAKAGAAIGVGIDHSAYNHREQPLGEAIRAALVVDLG